MSPDEVRLQLTVPTTPDVAFHVFTQEIDQWWRRETRFRWLTRGGTLSFEDGVLVEHTEDERFVVGQVSAWEPGWRLVFGWRAPSFAEGELTQVEVTFQPHPQGTRVTLVHRGWSALPVDHPARKGTGDGSAFRGFLGLYWGDLVGAFQRRCTMR